MTVGMINQLVSTSNIKEKDFLLFALALSIILTCDILLHISLTFINLVFK